MHRLISLTTRAGIVAGVVTASATFGVASAHAAASGQDSTFVTGNEQTNLAEITIGQLALQRSSNTAVRQLATMTISDHQAAQAKLKPVAQALTLTLPTVPSAMQQQQAAQLQAASAAQFDTLYSQIQVAGHQTAIADTNTEISGGGDPSVVTYAKGYLPVATMHLQMAQDALSQLTGTPNGVPAGNGGQAAEVGTGTPAWAIATTVGGTAAAIVGLLVFGRMRLRRSSR